MERGDDCSGPRLVHRQMQGRSCPCGSRPLTQVTHINVPCPGLLSHCPNVGPTLQVSCRAHGPSATPTHSKRRVIPKLSAVFSVPHRRLPRQPAHPSEGFAPPLHYIQAARHSTQVVSRLLWVICLEPVTRRVRQPSTVPCCRLGRTASPNLAEAIQLVALRTRAASGVPALPPRRSAPG